MDANPVEPLGYTGPSHHVITTIQETQESIIPMNPSNQQTAIR